MSYKQIKYFTQFILLIILIIPLLLPLFKPGMFVSDDAGWMIVRLSDFHRSLADGQFPVRWAGRLNYEYGYPVFNFLYPGVLYFGEIIHLLGFSYISSIKILFGLCVIFSAFFSYLWLKILFKSLPAFFGSLIYMYAPYHIFDLYKRGSLGEMVALSIVPLVFWSIERKSIFIGSLFMALIILSHNTLAFLLIPVIMLYAIVTKKDLKISLLTVFMGFLLSAFFWLPAIFDQQYTIFSNIKVSDWQDFFLGEKTFFLLGWGSTIIFLFSLILQLKKFKSQILFFQIIFLLSIYFSIPLSDKIWDITLLPKIVQFPYRFLSLTILSTAFLGASILSKFSKRIVIIGGSLLISLFIFHSSPLLKGITYEVHEEGYYATNEDTTTVKGEYMPRWVKNAPQERPIKKAELISGVGEIKLGLVKSNKMIIDANLKTNGQIMVNTIYFPGWYALMDKKNVEVSYNNPNGVIIIPVGSGQHKIEVFWQETPIRLLSDLISLVAFFSLIMFYVLKTRKRTNANLH